MIVEREGRLLVEGAMNQQTVPVLLEPGRNLVVQADREVDLAAVTVVDSAALAVLLDWRRAARAAGRGLNILHSPAALISLASLYGVTELLFPPAAESGYDNA